ncbi:hypothetical protein EVAR_13611_1 [Eumeta japonica]|uniref:Uncharacterized protein n=1 Tax=Eumeta variegata TaxID=151549 RepID=A0A4C1UTC9_EUMVA|nr:hypothetical protein EVAR_13611_1 [Eumeta japonica]
MFSSSAYWKTQAKVSALGRVPLGNGSLFQNSTTYDLGSDAANDGQRERYQRVASNIPTQEGERKKDTQRQGPTGCLRKLVCTSKRACKSLRVDGPNKIAQAMTKILKAIGVEVGCGIVIIIKNRDGDGIKGSTGMEREARLTLRLTSRSIDANDEGMNLTPVPEIVCFRCLSSTRTHRPMEWKRDRLFRALARTLGSDRNATMNHAFSCVQSAFITLKNNLSNMANCSQPEPYI